MWRRVVSAIPFAAGPLLSVWIVVFANLDLGQSRDLSHDVMFRDWRTFESLRGPRYFDASPYSIWASSDAFVWRSLRSGELPLWQRLQGGGYDPIVRIYSGVLHPVRFLAALVPLPQASTTISILGWWMAGIGSYLLARKELQWRSLTSVFTASILMLAPNTLSYLGFSGAILPLAHAPWLVLFWLKWFRDRSVLHLAGGSLLVGLTMLAGHPAMVMTALLMLVLAILFAIDLRTVGRSRVLFAGAGVVAGVLVAAPALLPPLLTLDSAWSYKNSTASGRSYEVPDWDAWFQSLVRIVIDTNSLSLQLDLGEYFHYLGPGVAALLCVGAILSLSARPTRWIGAMTIIGFVICYPNPLTGWLKYVPILEYWKTWYLLWIFTFGAAFSAGAAVQWLLAGKRYAAMLLISLAALPLVHRMMRHQLLWTVVPLRSEIVERIEEEGPFRRITGLRGQTHLPNLSEISRVEDLRASSPLHTWRYRAFLLVLDPELDTHSFPTTPSVNRFDSPYLTRFDTDYVLVSRPPTLQMATAVSVPHPPGYEELPLPEGLSGGVVTSSASSVLYRPSLAFPRVERARFSENFRLVSTAREAVAAMHRHRTDASAPDIVEATLARSRGKCEGCRVLRLHYPSDREVEIWYEAPQSALLVLADSFADGWKATVDGNAFPIVPVNLNSRGVFVPAGRHLLEMRYLPPGFVAGSILSVAAMVALAASALFSLRGKLTAVASPRE